MYNITRFQPSFASSSASSKILSLTDLTHELPQISDFRVNTDHLSSSRLQGYKLSLERCTQRKRQYQSLEAAPPYAFLRVSQHWHPDLASLSLRDVATSRPLPGGISQAHCAIHEGFPLRARCLSRQAASVRRPVSIPQDQVAMDLPSFNIQTITLGYGQAPMSRSTRQTLPRHSPCDGRLCVARNESYLRHSPPKPAFLPGTLWPRNEPGLARFCSAHLPQPGSSGSSSLILHPLFP